MTTDTVTRKKTFLDFLEREKNSTRERMRQCQIYLSQLSESPENLDEESDVRECVESILVHAEEDYGSFLHLLTVLGSSPKEAQAPSPALSSSRVEHVQNLDAVPDPGSPSKVQKTDTDDHQDDIEDLDFDPLRNDDTLSLGALGPGPGADDLLEEQLDTDDAHVAEGRDKPGALPTLSSYRPMPARPKPGGGMNVARSLPMAVPEPDKPVSMPQLPPEVDRDDIETPDIHTSIQLIARSLNTEALGELPKPRLHHMAD